MDAQELTQAKLAELDAALEGSRTCYVLIHDYPDPDAIASAVAFSHLLHARYGMRSRIVYGGLITRAENRAMVQQLGVKMTHASGVRWPKNGCIALLDTQPDFGNHSLPTGLQPRIVIDHHDAANPPRARFVDVRLGYGACATLLYEYLTAAGVEIPVPVATAIAFAIRTETQELGRDAGARDLWAYLQVYPRANQRKIARIANPKLPRSYFLTLKTALSGARVFRHIVHVHLGEVSSPEIVSQVADLLLRQTGIGWSLATGRYEAHLHLSLRASHPKAHAGRVMHKLLGAYGSGGGHGTMAGGRIPFDGNEERRWERLEALVAQRLLRALGYRKSSVWRPFIEPEAKNGAKK